MRITIDEKWCKGCGLCIAACKRQVLAFGDNYNTSGYRLPEAVNAIHCTGCRMCEYMCPDLCVSLDK